MRVGLMTREYPPNVYGGAGVHVEYLSRELAKKIDVEVHCWGKQFLDDGKLHVRGAEPWSRITEGTDAKYKAALEALSINLVQMETLARIDIVHTHTWYVSMAGFLAKKLFDIPFVLTTHSLEPLRAWKAEQLGSGYAMSSWMERTAILDADAVIAVSKGTKEDILRAYPDIVVEIEARGHEVASHGFEHRHHLLSSPRAIRSDLEAAVQTHRDILGRAPRFYRPTYGQLCAATLVEARRHQMEVVLWSRWGKEFVESEPGPVLRRLQFGCPSSRDNTGSSALQTGQEPSPPHRRSGLSQDRACQAGRGKGSGPGPSLPCRRSSLP